MNTEKKLFIDTSFNKIDQVVKAVAKPDEREQILKSVEFINHKKYIKHCYSN